MPRGRKGVTLHVRAPSPAGMEGKGFVAPLAHGVGDGVAGLRRHKAAIEREMQVADTELGQFAAGAFRLGAARRHRAAPQDDRGACRVWTTGQRWPRRGLLFFQPGQRAEGRRHHRWRCR